MGKHRNTIIIFERVVWLYYPVLLYSILRKHVILLFDFDCSFKRNRWLRNLIDTEKVKRICIQSSTKEHGDAIDIAESIIPHLRTTSLVRMVKSLYGSELVEEAFKKSIVNEVFKCIYINSYLKDANRVFSGNKVYFMPDKYHEYTQLIKEHSNYKPHCLYGVIIFRVGILLSKISQVCTQCTYRFAGLLYVITKMLFLLIGKLRKNHCQRKSFKYVVAINGLYQIVLSGGRGFNFLLDDAEINRSNTLFLLLNVDVNKKLLEGYQQQNYVFLNAKDLYNVGQLSKVNYNMRFMTKALKAALSTLIRGWGAPVSSMRVFLISLRLFINWNIIFQRISCTHYLYTNQENSQQTAINIMVSLQGGQSWDYFISMGGGYLYAKNDDFINHRHTLWSFLYCDNFVVMNQDLVDYHKLHIQKVKRYHAVGSIYSELTTKETDNTIRRKFLTENFAVKTEGKKIISFFDTSFVDDPGCPTNYQDCLEFYNDIYKLLQMREDVLVIIKPSKNRDWFISPEKQFSSLKKGKNIVELCERIKLHPRIFWAGGGGYKQFSVDFTYNNVVLAISDVVVTHCMSSPTAEALAIRKKAVWYESGNKHVGVMYDRIPNLVLHGYEQLNKALDNLLYSISDEEYNKYLDHYVRGKIEPYLDGKALTRFRNLLK